METIIWLFQVYSEYYLIFFWCILCGVVYCMKASKKTKDAIYGVAAYIPLALFCGLRDTSAGADTVTYCEWYSRFETVSVDGWLYRNFECGWVYLNKMLYWISPDPQMLLIFTSLVTTFGMGLFFFKTSPNFYLSTVLFVGFYFYIEQFTTIRQNLALVIALWGLRELWLGRKAYFVGLVLLAASFHVTSFIFLPLILIRNMSVMALVGSFIVIIMVALPIAVYGLAGISEILKYTPYYHYIGSKYDVVTPYGAGVIRIVFIQCVC